uniref:Spartin b n=1 Tax=Eptatretus burgeri TaxID=7764 RepID=A0A8C4Q5Q5_EPTBU
CVCVSQVSSMAESTKSQELLVDAERAVSFALQADEAGDLPRSLPCYRLAEAYLLQALAKQATESKSTEEQEPKKKMTELLHNVQTRLEALKEVTPLEPSAPSTLPSQPHSLYPHIAPPAEKIPFSPGSVHPNPGSGLPPTAIYGQPVDLPPAYSPQSLQGHTSLSVGTVYGEISLPASTMVTTASLLPVQQLLGPNAVETFLIPGGVQAFFVRPNGPVTAPSYPGYLRIVTFRPGAPVNNWLCPLYPGRSPALRSGNGLYMFPDVTPGAPPGAAVGIVLSADLPINVCRSFEEHISHFTQLWRSHNGNELPVFTNLTDGYLFSGANWISTGLIKGAEATGKALNKGTTRGTHPTEHWEKGQHAGQAQARQLPHRPPPPRPPPSSQNPSAQYPHHQHLPSQQPSPQSLPHQQTKQKPHQDSGMLSSLGLSTIWDGLETAAKTVVRSISSSTNHSVLPEQPSPHPFIPSTAIVTAEVFSGFFGRGLCCAHFGHV